MRQLNNFHSININTGKVETHYNLEAFNNYAGKTQDFSTECAVNANRLIYKKYILSRDKTTFWISPKTMRKHKITDKEIRKPLFITKGTDLPYISDEEEDIEETDTIRETMNFNRKPKTYGWSAINREAFAKIEDQRKEIERLREKAKFGVEITILSQASYPGSEEFEPEKGSPAYERAQKTEEQAA